MKLCIVKPDGTVAEILLRDRQPSFEAFNNEQLFFENYQYKFILREIEEYENVEIFVGDYSVPIHYKASTDWYETDQDLVFGGCFDLSSYKLKEQVLVSGTDGVGTKLLLAIEEQKHETIGIDCVAMCVNDVVAQGAEQLYFLDYLALGTVNPAKVEAIVAGVAAGCCEANAALIGGETAEMPDMYEADAYDVAGFAVGIAEKSQLLTPSNVKEGDFLIGLPSSGLHSNGYSLVRNIFFKKHSFKTTDKLPELSPKTLGEELLTPTKIYVKELLPLLKAGLVHGAAQITGGGFLENLPRMFSSALAAEIQLNSWPVLPIFKLIQKYGEIPPEEMYEIFNMGLGMILAVSPEHVE